jgi:hypothetical protein
VLRLLVLLLIIVGLLSQAARFLVVDDPQKSDVIVTLAGETNTRPARALELLQQQMAPRMFLDAENEAFYGKPLPEIAKQYIATLPNAANINVCPIIGLSTAAEAEDVSRCVKALDPHRVLLVTSDFHTRRALEIFRKRLPQYEFSAAAAHDPRHFGTAWWTQREWAKTTFDEWVKLAWWNLVDRWRSDTH